MRAPKLYLLVTAAALVFFLAGYLSMVRGEKYAPVVYAIAGIVFLLLSMKEKKKR